MATQEVQPQDIFEGAEKIEILGKLPAILWAYIENGHKLVGNLNSSPEELGKYLEEAEKILWVLESASTHLGNEDLKNRIGGHYDMLASLTKGEVSGQDFVTDFNSELASLAEMAGPRPESGENSILDAGFLSKEIAKAERVKLGRSSDIVVSVEKLEEIRSYLKSEVMTEGISSLLVIDYSGTLLVSIGDRVELDVVSLAAVAAANFAATEKIAHLIGERDFMLLFYKGHSESFHFCRVGDEYIIVTIFDNSLSLGLLRLKISEVSKVLESKLPKRGG